MTWVPAAIQAAALIGSHFLNKGDKDKFRRIDVQTQEQKGFHKDIISQLRGQEAPGGNYAQSQDYLSRILSGDQGAYDQFAAPYLQNFHEQIIPRLAEQFGALGGGLGGGIAGSSGFGQAIGGAGSSLQAQLSNLFAHLQQQAAQQAQGQYNFQSSLGLGTQAFQPAYQPGNIGFGGQVLAGAGKGFGENIGQNLGYNVQNAFGNNPNKATGTDTTPPVAAGGFGNITSSLGYG